jgi:hypothetical protein
MSRRQAQWKGKSGRMGLTALARNERGRVCTLNLKVTGGFFFIWTILGFQEKIRICVWDILRWELENLFSIYTFLENMVP